MKQRFNLLLIIPFIFLLSSCFKEDEAVPRHPRGNVITDTIEMTEYYRNQVYYDLSDSLAKPVIKTSTDLGFSCSEADAYVILNSSCFMKAADIGEVPFGEAYDTSGVIWKFDKSTGDPDSMAIGKWYNVIGGDTTGNGHLYLINRGMDENGNPLGLCQMIIDSLAGGTYYFRWAGLDGSNPVNASITKDRSYSYKWYSFTSSGPVPNAEPEKESWDLLFTQYTTLLFTDEGAAYPYLVTGVLMNRYNVACAMDTIHSFSEINLEIAGSMELNHEIDAIGWDWKKYSFDNGGYTVLYNRNYIIRDHTGIYYKLRFVSFYNANGVKGYPVIEFAQL